MNKLICTLFLSMLSVNVYSAVSCSTVTGSLASLDKVQKSGKYRVYYATSGVNAISNQVDTNSNNIPDFVEDILIQAQVTEDALDQLGFIHPLDSDRYNGSPEYVDFHIVSMTANGLAYEQPSIYINKVSKENKCSLQININKDLDFPGGAGSYWSIVTHELFHLYQYGYNQFKGGWYLEGMTNMVERLLKLPNVSSNSTPLPATQTELNTNIYSIPYNTLWHRLGALADPTNGQLMISPQILNIKYTNGTKAVFMDELFRGHAFIKKVLENMKVESDQLSTIEGWDPHNWLEADQLRPENRPYMLKAIHDAMNYFNLNTTTEQINFLNLN